MTAWSKETYLKVQKMPQQALDIRQEMVNDLRVFARVVNPGYAYGDIHMEIFKWIMDYTLFGQGEDTTANKLLMLPRAHLKSHCVATACAWLITRHPEITMLYVSATAELATSQLYAIKNILESAAYRRYFPEYVHPEDGKRTKWTESKIMIDHFKRDAEGIRDATVATAGLTTNTTGWHADLIIADDLVVPENAYTEDGRLAVSKKSSQFTSIRNAGGFTLACGTRYHPKDIYSEWKVAQYEVYDDEGMFVEERPVWDIIEFAVEVNGEFLWPRTIRSDGKAYGFNMSVLARIRAEYSDKTQFYAQYYNDPNEASSNRITPEKFQYYNKHFLQEIDGKWHYKERRLNVYAAVDFAFSLKKSADFTAIVVIGMDSEGNVYVLDIDRFKTDRTYEYYKHIAALHSKWNFNKMRAEISVAQKVIVNDIKDYVRKEGLRLSIDEFRPTHKEGTKEERIAAVLEPRYDDLKIYHFKGGWNEVLEEEVIQARPVHDDVKDSFASAVEIAVKPSTSFDKLRKTVNKVKFNSRFGGVA